MPRTARHAPGGQVYHVLNRSVGKMHLFAKDADFEAFQAVMIEAHRRHPIRILSYCVLSNHWHFVVWPEADGAGHGLLPLAGAHACDALEGRAPHRGIRPPVSGPIQELPRAERRPSVDRLAVRRAAMRWGRAWSSERRTGVGEACGRGGTGDRELKAILSPWPVERPADWTRRVNAPLSAKELGRLRLSLERGRPYGADDWVKRTASELRLEHTVRPEGRPPKVKRDDLR